MPQLKAHIAEYASFRGPVTDMVSGQPLNHVNNLIRGCLWFNFGFYFVIILRQRFIQSAGNLACKFMFWLGRFVQQALCQHAQAGKLLAETIACREQGAAWQPRLRSAEAAVRRAAAGRRTETLCEDLARVEQAKHEIDGNLNIGLVMAVLLQEIAAHVRGDQAHATA